MLSVSHCIAYLYSFRYGSSRCSVSTKPVLHHVIRHTFSFAPDPPFALFLFLHITTNTTHGTAQHSSCRPATCVHTLFIVDQCIRLRSTMEIVKDRSHVNQTQTISPVYFFLINFTDQDLHRPSRFREYAFLIDISSRTIYSFIYYVKLCQGRTCKTGNAKAAKP